MAVYNASKMLAGTQPKVLPTAGGVNVVSTIGLTTPLLVSDTINFLQLASDPGLPGNGPTILDMALDSDKLDSNGSPLITFNVGDAGAANRYFATTNVAQNGGIAYPSKAGIVGFQPFASSFASYTSVSLQYYTIVATCAAAAATWQNGSIRLLVGFTYDP